MNCKRILIALSATTLVFTWLLAGCGTDDNPLNNDLDGGADGDADGDTDSDADGDADDPCANITPCGGDVVGTWNVTNSCLAVSGPVTFSGLHPDCVASVTGSLQVTGTWTVNADGTYVDGTTTTGTETIELSPECKQLSGTVLLCDRISNPLSSSYGYATVACVDNTVTGGCTCPATINQTGGIGVAPGFPRPNGNYTIAGTTLTISADEQAYSYCVEGTTLKMTPVSTIATGTVTGSVVLQKQ